MRWLALSSFALLSVSACSGTDSVVGARAPEATQFTRVDLGTLGGTSSYATAINNGNMVVGWSQTASGATHAFRWTAAEGMIDLGTLPGDDMSQAVAVLDAPLPDGGQILGVSGSEGKTRPVVWSISGSRRALAATLIPGFTIPLPAGFNTHGDVIGSDAGGPGVQHAWVWSEASGKYDLSSNFQGGTHAGSANAITSTGLVLLTAQVPECEGSQCSRSYLWNKTAGYRAIGTPAGESKVSVAGLALSEGGTVAGWLTKGTAGAVPYRWSTNSGFTMLANYSTANDRYGYAAAVSSNGTTVGGDFDPASGSIVASLWSADGAITKLSPYDMNPSLAVAINDHGTIAGWKVIAGGVSHAVVWQFAAPSSTLALARSMSMTVDHNARSVRPSRSAACLSRTASITSRQSLFSCLVDTDRAR